MIANRSSTVSDDAPVTIASWGAMRNILEPAGSTAASIAMRAATTRMPVSGSGSRTGALRIVEGRRADLCSTTVDRDSVGGRRALLPTQHHRLAEPWRMEARRDVADDVVVDEDGCAFDRCRSWHRETQQSPPVDQVSGAQQCGAA